MLNSFLISSKKVKPLLSLYFARLMGLGPEQKFIIMNKVKKHADRSVV